MESNLELIHMHRSASYYANMQEQYELGVADSTKEVTVTSFEQLQALMKEAMEADIQANSLNLNNSRVHALKVKVYQALMNST
ncbi:TPA: ZmpA/ZmpB/ZmpC family metallo-endopeptidase, partial [Streptococcus suis]